MQYRGFGKLDWKVSALGFGAMRLPVLDDNPAHIDEPEAIRMIRHSIDNGVNYLDTAYPYHGGRSEPLVAQALADGYRDKVRLATKLPSWLIQKADDFDKYLEEQLERLKTDYIDFYLLHGLNKQRWPQLRDLGILQKAEKAIEDGRIRYLGFSFHDDVEAFKEIIDGCGMWTFCQIQYNYMDTDYQAGTEGLKYAADKGLALVIMEPIRGGQLAKEPPEQVAKIWAQAKEKKSPVEWALQWIWNQPEVAVVLSGMTTMQHVEENLESADRSGVGSMTGDDVSILEQVTEAYRGLSPISCTNCKYCMPCPNGVDIPGVFGLYNDATMYGDLRRSKALYLMRLTEEQRADKCEECGDCLDLCPQQIEIPDWMEKADELLAPKK
ncbi:MAG: aldo/keto reductase [Deltaproteobacteria bacterium]|nr:aldo/keto reductase [Deltaproteobacteria bacterium]